MVFEIDDLRALLALQELDTRIQTGERRLAAARTGEELRPLRERLAAAEAGLSDLSARLSSLQRDLRYREQEHQDLRAEIAANEKRLYSGIVRNPKEAEQLQSFVASLRRRLDAGQEKALELMLEIEPLEPQRDEAQAEVEAARNELAAAEEQLSRTAAELETELPKMGAGRVEAAAALPPDLLSAYETLRSKRPGSTVVAVVEDGKCSGCRMTLPFITVREARAGTLHTCENCGRILVVRS